MKYKYGDFSEEQISSITKEIRKQIFFLLLIADPKNNSEYKNINVNDAFNDLMYQLDGMNELLLYPTKLVKVMSLLEKAHSLYMQDNFDFLIYRKLVLDAGNEVLRLLPKGGD